MNNSIKAIAFTLAFSACHKPTSTTKSNTDSTDRVNMVSDLAQLESADNDVNAITNDWQVHGQLIMVQQDATTKLHLQLAAMFMIFILDPNSHLYSFATYSVPTPVLLDFPQRSRKYK